MYVARFSYDVLPVNRQQALDFIHASCKRRNRAGSPPVSLSR